MRLAVLTNAPAPYRVPVFERIAAEPGVASLVLFDGASDSTTRASDLRFPCEEMSPGVAFRRRNYQDDPRFAERATLRLGWRYGTHLAAFRPDVVISLEFGWRSLHAAAYAARAGIPLLLWWEGTPFTERRVGWLRRRLRRGLVRRASGLLGFGRESVQYLQSIAPDGTRVDFVPQAVDNARIAREVDRWRGDREGLRASLGVRGNVLVCVGRLLPHKGIRELLAALARLRAGPGRDAFTLLLAGDGPLRAEAEHAAGSLGGALRVLGGVAPDDLPRLLAVADALVFPTLRDCWGMVVNEALAAGIPVLGSRYAGASGELICSPDFGLRFDPLDAASFDDALRAAVLEDRWRGYAPAQLRRAVAEHTCDAAAEALLASARRSLAGNPHPDAGGARLPRSSSTAP